MIKGCRFWELNLSDISRNICFLDYASQIQPGNTDSAGVSSVSLRMMGRRLAVKCCQGMCRQLDWCKESMIL